MALSGATKSISADVDNWQGYFDSRAKESALCNLVEIGFDLPFHAFSARRFLLSVVLDTLESMSWASDSLRDGAKEVPVTSESQTRALRGVYGISVMSELSGVGPQTLRLYERRGLLTPTRTDGGTRRYSEADLDTLGRITALIDDGVNLVGIRLILSLEAENAVLAARISQLTAEGD
eukprot:gene25837-31029_t